MSIGYGQEGIRQVCATLLMRAMYLSASAVAVCFLRRYIKCSAFIFLPFTLWRVGEVTLYFSTFSLDLYESCRSPWLGLWEKGGPQTFGQLRPWNTVYCAIWWVIEEPHLLCFRRLRYSSSSSFVNDSLSSSSSSSTWSSFSWSSSATICASPPLPLALSSWSSHSYQIPALMTV